MRVDRGLFADVVAGERPVFVSQRDPLEAVPGDRIARTLVAVPMRDRIGRPVGLLLALDDRQRELDLAAVESIRRLAGVVAGELASSAAMRRSRAALGTLPELAEVAHADDTDVTAQLESLALIVARATDSDSAVVRVRDAAGHYLETRAVVSTHGDAVADAIGTRTRLSEPEDHAVRGDGGTSRDAVGRRLREATRRAEAGARLRRREAGPARRGRGRAGSGGGRLRRARAGGLEDAPESWSPAGRRVLRELSARTVASFPIDSRYGRHAVLYVVRTTARPFDDVDRACIRIVTAHAQHVIDRHVSRQQTARAIDAARSAVRLLGEALVAGVRAERTLRFLPRLFHEMFAPHGVRVWRRDRSGVASLVAGAGTMATEEASDALHAALRASARAGARHDARSPTSRRSRSRRGARCASASSSQLAGERSLGVEEQRLAVDVAARIQEAMFSAGQAAAQQLQLERVRALQEVVAAAHERLSEQHVDRHGARPRARAVRCAGRRRVHRRRGRLARVPELDRAAHQPARGARGDARRGSRRRTARSAPRWSR